MFADFEQENRNEDYLEEYRQKLNTPSAESFEERKNDINRSKNVFVGTVSGIALAAVVGWFVLSPRYATEGNVEIPVIRRPQTAVKVQPSEPGGMEIQNQDKSVYDIIEKKENKAPVVENLLPPPEEPQLPVITAEEVAPLPEVTVKSPTIEKAEAIITDAEKKIVPTTATATPEPTKAPAPIAQPTPAPQKEVEIPTPIKTAETASKAEPQPTPKTETKPVVVKVEEVKIPTKAAEQKKPVVAGDWQIQLISSPNRSAVDNAWAGLIKKYPSLNGQPREIETADLGSKGTYYRLKAGAFATRDGADKLCNEIKSLGGTCIVKKK